MVDVKPCWAEILWVLAAAGVGGAMSALTASVLHWPRSWFLVPYVGVVGMFLYAADVCLARRAAERAGAPPHGDGPAGGQPRRDGGLSLGICGIPRPRDRATPHRQCPHHPQ